MRTKSRLTITLPELVLNKVDHLVDGKEIRSRSHAIEHLIQKGLGSKIIDVVILAGGKKKDDATHLLKKISGKYLFSHHIENFKKYGIKNILLCAGIHTNEIRKIFGDGSQFGIYIKYIEEQKPMGTAGAIQLASSCLGGNAFLVIHGDIFTELNLSEFIEFHFRENSLITIGVKPRMGEKKYGQVFMQGNKIIKFLESGTNQGISIVNTGIYAFKNEVLKIIDENKKINLESAIFPSLASKGQLSAFIFQGAWTEIS